MLANKLIIILLIHVHDTCLHTKALCNLAQVKKEGENGLLVWGFQPPRHHWAWNHLVFHLLAKVT